jgi:hypothetical protein
MVAVGFEVSDFCGSKRIWIDSSEWYRQSDSVAVRDGYVEHMLIRRKSFDWGGRSPSVTDIEVASSVLLCDIDVGRAAP